MKDRIFLTCAMILLAAATIGLIASILQQGSPGRAGPACARGTFSIYGDEIELVFDNGEVWVTSFVDPGNTTHAQEI